MSDIVIELVLHILHVDASLFFIVDSVMSGNSGRLEHLCDHIVS